MKMKGCAILWWMGNKWHLLLQLKASWELVATWFERCVFAVSLWLEGWLQGCLWRHNLCVWEIEAGLVLRFIWDSFILQFGEKKYAMGKKTPWKTSSSSFPLLSAESFRELTVTQKFSKRPRVIFSPSHAKEILKWPTDTKLRHFLLDFVILSVSRS